VNNSDPFVSGIYLAGNQNSDICILDSVDQKYLSWTKEIFRYGELFVCDKVFEYLKPFVKNLDKKKSVTISTKKINQFSIPVEIVGDSEAVEFYNFENTNNMITRVLCQLFAAKGFNKG